MSRFDLEKTNKDPEEWGQLALQNVGNNGLQMHVFGGFALAATVAVMSNPLTGALVAGYVLFSAFEKGRNQQKNFDAVRKGCVAHVLDGGEFRAYVRQVGHDTVMKELQYATEEEYEISDAALDYLEQVAPTEAQDTPRLAGFPAPELPQPQGLNFTLISTQTLAPGQIVVPDNVTTDLAQTPRLVIYGVPGSGKDFLMSHLYREAKNHYGNKITFFMLDCKDDPKETGYFDGVIDKLYRKKVFKSDAKDVFIWVKAILEEFEKYDAGTGFKVLVCNEFAAINASLDQLPKDKELGCRPSAWWKTKIASYGSSGDSEGIRIWMASQNGHTESLKLSGGDKAIFKPVLIAKDDSMSETELILVANVIPQDAKISTEEMQKLCAASPVKRCMFHGAMNKWIPVPELANYSGYNRDKREFASRPGQQDALTDQEREELRDATSAVKTQAPPKTDNTEQLINKLSRSRQTSLEDFIAKDLKAPERIQELKPAIVSVLREAKRNDLLEAFNLGWLAIVEPIAAMKHYAMGKDLNLEEIKEAWLLHTGQQLNDQGAQLLKNKINE